MMNKLLTILTLCIIQTTTSNGQTITYNDLLNLKQLDYSETLFYILDLGFKTDHSAFNGTFTTFVDNKKNPKIKIEVSDVPKGYLSRNPAHMSVNIEFHPKAYSIYNVLYSKIKKNHKLSERYLWGVHQYYEYPFYNRWVRKVETEVTDMQGKFKYYIKHITLDTEKLNPPTR